MDGVQCPKKSHEMGFSVDGPRKNGPSWIFALLLLCGCSGAPTGVPVPQFDAESAAARAIEKFDASGDGLLSVEELAQYSALTKHLGKHDANEDGQFSQEELSDRILSWTAQGTGMMAVSFVITLDGKPLPNADVVFQPAEFLGDVLKAANGKSNGQGRGSMAIPRSELPKELSRIRGVQPGLYQILVTHKTKQIPSTPLSVEVSEETISPVGHHIKITSDK